MAISVNKRWAVLQRDNFTCQYCGRSAPDVILELDHVIPSSHGGSDNLDNLVASCEDCNRGKGATTPLQSHPLLSITPPLDLVPMGTVSTEEIESKRSGKGGWTKVVLAEWGVPWPPPKGWKTRLTRTE